MILRTHPSQSDMLASWYSRHCRILPRLNRAARPLRVFSTVPMSTRLLMYIKQVAAVCPVAAIAKLRSLAPRHLDDTHASFHSARGRSTRRSCRTCSSGEHMLACQKGLPHGPHPYLCQHASLSFDEGKTLINQSVNSPFHQCESLCTLASPNEGYSFLADDLVHHATICGPSILFAPAVTRLIPFPVHN